MIVLHSIVWLYWMLYKFQFKIHKIPFFFFAFDIAESAHKSQRVKNSELLWTSKTLPGNSVAITIS